MQKQKRIFPPQRDPARGGTTLLIGIIIIVAVAIVAFGGVFAYQYFLAKANNQPQVQSQQQNQNQQQATNQQTNNNQPTDQTASWKTYKNAQYGFELKYPENVLVSYDVNNDVIDVSIIGAKCDNPKSRCPPPFMILTPIYIPPYSNLTSSSSIEELVRERFQLKQFNEFNITPQQSNWDVDVIKKITFGKNKISGYLVHQWLQAFGSCNYLGKQNDNTVHISRGNVGLNYAECTNDQLFNQMISTFKFTK